MVNIQQATLSTFKQQLAIVGNSLVEIRRRVSHVWAKLVGVLRIFVVNRVDFERSEVVVESGDGSVFLWNDFFESPAQTFWIDEVAHANRVSSSGLVAVAGSDASHGRADGFSTASFFESRFFRHVVRKNDVGSVADFEPFGRDFSTAFGDPAVLFEEGFRVDDNASRDDGDNFVVQNSCRQK